MLLSGEPFGSWNTYVPMISTGQHFEYTMSLPAGTYKYNFIVDGQQEVI